MDRASVQRTGSDVRVGLWRFARVALTRIRPEMRLIPLWRAKIDGAKCRTGRVAWRRGLRSLRSRKRSCLLARPTEFGQWRTRRRPLVASRRRMLLLRGRSPRWLLGLSGQAGRRRTGRRLLIGLRRRIMALRRWTLSWLSVLQSEAGRRRTGRRLLIGLGRRMLALLSGTLSWLLEQLKDVGCRARALGRHEVLRRGPVGDGRARRMTERGH